MSALQRQLMKRNMPLLPPNHSLNRHKRTGGPRDYSPSDWSEYFDSYLDLHVPEANGTFRLYLVNMIQEEENLNSPLIILLHGAGYSGLSWGVFVKQLFSIVHAKFVAVDLRGHGSTETTNDSDLSSERLTQDICLIYQELLKHPSHSKHLETSPVIIMGHSMGGAIATRATLNELSELDQNLVGLVVIDVVEGTAMESLSGMKSILRARPTSFPTLEKAIEWSVRSGQTKNTEAAKLSMPGMLKKVLKNQTKQQEEQLPPPPTIDKNIDVVKEEEEESSERSTESNEPVQTTSTENGSNLVKSSSASSSNSHFEWRVNLFQSEDYWHGWFSGLSKAFLESPAQAKLLILAGLDRLDRELTVGQMQGKFQMQVLPQCGHAVHEDLPEQVSQVLATYLTRNKFSKAKADFQPVFPGC